MKWYQQATTDPGVRYYRTRHWASPPPAAGCAASPDRIYLEVTQACNLSCPMCFRGAGTEAAEEMTTSEILDLLAKLAQIGVHEIRLTGGEPTVRPDILQVIDGALEAGFFVTRVKARPFVVTV